MGLYDDVLELGDRLRAAGWVLAYDAPARPPELREHDEHALEALEELLGYPPPAFLRRFALEVGAVFLTGHAEPGSRLADVLPQATTPHGASGLSMLTTVPLPTALQELEERMEEDDDDEPIGFEVVADSHHAAGVSGGPGLCLLCGSESMNLQLYYDVDPDAPVGHDLEGLVRLCLAQGGLLHLPEDPAAAALFRELGQGLGG